MSIFTITRTTRHFYLNYHHAGSNSLWIHSAFMRYFQFSLREVICFLSVSFLAYGTRIADYLSLEYLLPIISILCLQETFGSTLFFAYQITLTITPLALFLFAVQKIGLNYHNYLATELLILLPTTFLISYSCTEIQTKKLSLLYNALYFAAHAHPHESHQLIPFEILGIYILGMFMTVFISFIIFPIFATFDIENRFNYSLSKLQQMHVSVIHAFLCHDKTSAHMSLTTASVLENLVHKAIEPIQKRIDEARFEPVRFLKRRFNNRHRYIIDLTLQQQQDFITKLMFYVCSLQLMVKHCRFNDYHKDFTHELESSLLHLSSCQSAVISSILSHSSVPRDEYNRQIANLEEAFQSLRTAYTAARLQRIEHVLETATIIHYEDHISHDFFIFQLGSIVRLLTKGIKDKTKKQNIPKKNEKTKFDFKQIFKFDVPHLLSAFKNTVIIGVGAIFVLVPTLSKTFENGQWILFTLCVTLGDTVGGAFTTMKMRLMGTLLGAIWAYVTYLVVHDDVYQILGMLTPWIFVFGYLKLLPNWGYTATVAAFTPLVINLGRLPHANTAPAANYALTRIQESFIGITIAAVLTLVIFPIFAIDLLKDNIHKTLTMCEQSIISVHRLYDKLFDHHHRHHHHHHSNEPSTYVELEDEKLESLTNDQQSSFHRLINLQRVLIEHAAVEPILWCVNKAFSIKLYHILAQQQFNTYRMLHSINEALAQVKEHSKTIQSLQINAGGGNFLPDFHAELADLSKQLINCFHLWTSYFVLSQTKSYRLIRRCHLSHRELIENNFRKHEQCLIDLHEAVNRLQNRYQDGLNQLLQHYLDRLLEGESSSMFVPYANNEEADSIFIAYQAMHYSITQFTQSALTLGHSVHTIFEVETTRLYRSF